ncbi:MAG: DNA repair protein RecO [Saprospiraceae bacterium]|nr:DNA repair protein RecO [Saprospiraceae bacterium]
MLLTTKGIVFRTVKYGETSVIADIFTEERGLHTFVGGRVRSPRSRMPFNLFQPMSVVEAVAYYRDDPGALNRLKEVRAAVVFTQIPFDVRRGAVALFMAEVCRKCIREAEKNSALFDFLLAYLLRLDDPDMPFAALPVQFLVQLSEHLGFQPEVPETGGDWFFDLREGLFSPESPRHGAFLTPEATADMLLLLHPDPDAPAIEAMGRDRRKRLLQGLLQFYRWHIPGFEGVHTPEVMEWVWG